MSGPGLPIAIRTAADNKIPLRLFDLSSIPPTLVRREPIRRRTKIWEFNTNLHCSIVGTCLSVHELRQTLRRAGVVTGDYNDHELHGIAVGLAGQHDEPARQLQKALDHRHKLAVSRFARAGSTDAVQAMWHDAVQSGDIPGAYWATLTHPLANQAIIREAFGEVHMLSHLVGSANRADVRRLRVLETEKAALEAKLERQQQAFHEAVVRRDSQINALRQALADRIQASPGDGRPAEDGGLQDLICDRERRLVTETRRREALEFRLAAVQGERDAERANRLAAEVSGAAMHEELQAIETSFASQAAEGAPPRLDGLTVLYVGGRPNQIGHMRGLVEGLGAGFLHHDGGVEHHLNLLPGLTSRCDVALFPVDCISHAAATALKSFCRHAAKRFLPLRSASVTSLLAALQKPEVAQLAEAAD